MPAFDLTLNAATADGVVEVLDATWQDGPVWRADDRWTACWGPSLIHDRAPYPGVAVRALASTDQQISVNVTGGEPDPALRLVATHQVIFGAHGIAVSIESENAELAIPEGLYRCEIRVNANDPSMVSAIQVRLVDHEPRGHRSPAQLAVAADLRSALAAG